MPRDQREATGGVGEEISRIQGGSSGGLYHPGCLERICSQEEVPQDGGSGKVSGEHFFD